MPPSRSRRRVSVGSYSTSAQTLRPHPIQRWNPSSWSVVPSPNPDPTTNLLSDIDSASAGDLWAIGKPAPALMAAALDLVAPFLTRLVSRG
jgi:hypothetical protein